MNTFTVGINKAYFPKEIHPQGPAQLYQHVVKVKAENRTDAAHKAWLLFGNDWISQMNPKQTSVRHISLDVNDPQTERGKELSNLGRMMAIRVYTESVGGNMSKAKELLNKMNETRDIGYVNCAYFDPETGSCTTGCKNVQVLPGGPCPFYNPALGGVNSKMHECPCYQALGQITGDRRFHT